MQKKVFFVFGLPVLLTALLMAVAGSDSLAGVYGGKSGLTAKREPMPVRQIIVKYKAPADARQRHSGITDILPRGSIILWIPGF
jgi:hypothetical protein